MSEIIPVKATETGREFYYQRPSLTDVVESQFFTCAACGSLIHPDFLQIHTDRHDKGL